mmetsp:Transcript_72262/g.217199  ORF Transcript_72262/g.217199 Transcript_72262/m.217199 type:complete len:485 (-) Transcript_72262:71-1525(-)
MRTSFPPMHTSRAHVPHSAAVACARATPCYFGRAPTPPSQPQPTEKSACSTQDAARDTCRLSHEPASSREHLTGVRVPKDPGERGSVRNQPRSTTLRRREGECAQRVRARHAPRRSAAQQVTAAPASCSGDIDRLVVAQHNVDIAGAAEDDGAALVDVSRHEVKHPVDGALEHARRRDAARGLDDESHGEALVEDAQLAAGRLLVGRVDEAAAVEDGAVHVRHHRAHVARGVLVVLKVINRFLDGLVPVGRVALVARVDLLAAALGELHVGVRVNELAEGRGEREALDLARLEAHDQLSRRPVHAVARGNDVVAGAEDVLDGAQRALRHLLVDGEDGSGGHVAVDVRRAVERVEGDAEAAGVFLGNDDRLLILLRDEDAARARLDERVDEDVVGEDIELLLVVAARVLLTVHAEEAGDASLGARTRGGLAREAELRHEHSQLQVLGVGHQPLRQRREVALRRHILNRHLLVGHGCCFLLLGCYD